MSMRWLKLLRLLFRADKNMSCRRCQFSFIFVNPLVLSHSKIYFLFSKTIKIKCLLIEVLWSVEKTCSILHILCKYKAYERDRPWIFSYSNAYENILIFKEYYGNILIFGEYYENILIFRILCENFSIYIGIL